MKKNVMYIFLVNVCYSALFSNKHQTQPIMTTFVSQWIQSQPLFLLLQLLALSNLKFDNFSVLFLFWACPLLPFFTPYIFLCNLTAQTNSILNCPLKIVHRCYMHTKPSISSKIWSKKTKKKTKTCAKITTITWKPENEKAQCPIYIFYLLVTTTTKKQQIILIFACFSTHKKSIEWNFNTKMKIWSIHTQNTQKNQVKQNIHSN